MVTLSTNISIDFFLMFLIFVQTNIIFYKHISYKNSKKNHKIFNFLFGFIIFFKGLPIIILFNVKCLILKTVNKFNMFALIKYIFTISNT